VASDLRNNTALDQDIYIKKNQSNSLQIEETSAYSSVKEQGQQNPGDTVFNNTIESDVDTNGKLLLSSAQISSRDDGDPGETVVKVAESSGPFGVPLGDWALIILIGLVVFVAVYVLRQYIQQIISILETACYWTMKGIMYPFQLLFIGMRSLSYPVKEFCVYTYNATDEYYRPWKVVS